VEGPNLLVVFEIVEVEVVEEDEPVEADVRLIVTGDVTSASPRSEGPMRSGVDPAVGTATAFTLGCPNLPFCTANASRTANPIL